MKTIKTIEWEITPLCNGEIIDIYWYENIKKAKEEFDTITVPAQLWKVEHIATMTHDGLTLSTDRREKLMMEKK